MTRQNNHTIPAQQRILTFREFHTPLNDTVRAEQASRCMNCGVPLCQSAMRLSGMVTGCPLHNLIPEWNTQIANGHPENAYRRLSKTSNFPEFTGRVCPALCEKACINGQYEEPTTVHDNELYVIEKAFADGTVKPRIPAVRSGKKIAVIGAGPSGLAVADELNHRGHEVTVYEREDRIGGLLMYGIPNMKLDKTVILRRQRLMEAEGVRFVTGVNIGEADRNQKKKSTETAVKSTDVAVAEKADKKSLEVSATVEKKNQSKSVISVEELKKTYDAVILCCGAKQPRSLPAADPAKVKGVMYAVDFLKQTTKHLLDRGLDADAWKAEESRDAAELLKAKGLISAKGKHVVVVGGGDTGNDCIGTVVREGCKSVTALEMMPEPPVDRAPSNPWPEWPKVKKTDYGHEEAAFVFGKDPRVFETTVKEVHTNKKGELKEIVTVKVAFKDGKLCEVEGSEKKLPCDLLLIAAGFVGCESYTAQAFGTELTNRGVVATAPDKYATNVAGVFTAGDMHRGQSLVVWAIAEGRACAREVDQYLMGYSNL